MLRTLYWVCWFFGYMWLQNKQYRRAVRLGQAGGLEEQTALVKQQVRQWASRLLHNISVKLVVEGKENLPKAGETVVFACNHQSYVDIPVVLAGLDEAHPLLAKKELGKVPFMGKWMHILGCVFVDRADMRSAIAALRESEAVIKSGRSLIIFPEGTRSKSDKMAPFKEGTVHVASRCGVKIVPLAVDGTYRALEGSGYRLKKCTVRLVVLPAVDTTGLTKEQQKALPGQLAQMIETARAGKKKEL